MTQVIPAASLKQRRAAPTFFQYQCASHTVVNIHYPDPFIHSHSSIPTEQAVFPPFSADVFPERTARSPPQIDKARPCTLSDLRCWIGRHTRARPCHVIQSRPTQPCRVTGAEVRQRRAGYDAAGQRPGESDTCGDERLSQPAGVQM